MGAARQESRGIRGATRQAGDRPGEERRSHSGPSLLRESPPDAARSDAAPARPGAECAPGDRRGWTGAAEHSDGELARRLAARAREVVLERHAPEARTRRLIEIYGRLAAGRGP